MQDLRSRRHTRLSLHIETKCLAAVGVLALAGLLTGCESTPPPTPQKVTTDLPPAPAAMKGLVGTEVTFRNVAPTIISGYGIVVGLNGTGGQPLNDTIAASMERQMALAGMTSTNEVLKGTVFEGKTPREILRDKNVAVVVVSAAIAPGLPVGTTFDVQVGAVNASSLEGGKLWTTDLRIGPPSAFGQAQATKLGEAAGQLYMNPFGTSDIGTMGRILGGGTLTNSLRIVMTMGSPSHQRARQIVSAINSRFPDEPGDDGPICRGENDTNIRLSVPVAFRTEPAAFLSLVKNLQIDQSNPEAYARRYVETIKNEVGLAESMSWALEALGPRAMPALRDLYDHQDIVPKMAGLRAGARLNDPRVVEPLQELAKNGQGSVRTRAIALLGEVDAGPRLDLFLREQLKQDDLLVRIAAYEALADRAERARFNQLLRMQQDNPDLRKSAITVPQLQAIARVSLPSGTLQGVSREPIAGKFLFDRVPEGKPLVYVTQQNVPRVVLFGADDTIDMARITQGVSIWDGKLMVGVDPQRTSAVKLRLQRVGRPGAITQSVNPKLSDIIATLARETTPSDPRPGLNMSYSEVVATLSSLEQAGATRAAFATENDRLSAALLAAQSSRDMAERPETPEDAEAVIVRRGDATTPATATTDEKPVIVPIEQPKEPK
ncbi:MAG: flagellar basal body P-ring protein FlgI [Phycisphaerales bacterium]